MKIKIISIFFCLAAMQQNYAFLRKQTFYEKAQYIIGVFSNSSNKLGYLTTNSKKQSENSIPSLSSENTSLKINREALRSFLDNIFQNDIAKTLDTLKIIKKLFQLLDNNGSEIEISTCLNGLLREINPERPGNAANHLSMDICDQHLPQNEFCIEQKRIIESNTIYYNNWYQKIYGVPRKKIE